MQNSKEHIRHCLLYEYQLGHSATEATRNICQAVGQDSTTLRTALNWFDRFRNQDYSLQDMARSGRPTTINLDELKQLLEKDPSLTTTAVASKLGCTQPAVHYHLKRLEYVNKLGGWSPHDLTPSQLKKRVEYCDYLLKWQRNRGWLDNLITGDEKWVLYTNPIRKKQWCPRGKQAKPTPKAGLHPKKRMLCVWWGVRGVIHWELLPERSTVTGALYRSQLSRLKTKVDEVGPRGRNIYIQHDNAKPHVSQLVRTKLKELGWQTIPHPPYSPDLAPSDYHLFLSLSNHLRGKQFQDEEDLKKFLREFFNSKSPEFYARGIRDLPRRWQEVIDSKGAYVLRN